MYKQILLIVRSLFSIWISACLFWYSSFLAQYFRSERVRALCAISDDKNRQNDVDLVSSLF